jgi:C1A family cysteine protease
VARWADLAEYLSCAVLLSLCVSCGVVAQERLSLAPINPEFLAFLDARARGEWPAFTKDGHALGCIPSPVDPTPVSIKPRLARPIQGLPARYDLRDIPGKLLPVGDQSGCGTCWAFASYGSLESCMAPTDTLDCSEQHLKNTHGFGYEPCEGGHWKMTMAYLTRWSGPVAAADDPYDPTYHSSPADLPVCKHVQEVLWLPPCSDAADNDIIKQAVMTHGGVYTRMLMDMWYYCNTYAAYCLPPDGTGAAHAVCIVGWDDDFPASRFCWGVPPGDGAFICRNSWGTDFGEDGYFYVSYHDKRIGKWENVQFCNAEAPTNYATVYQYDPYGWVSSLGSGGETFDFANVFEKSTSEEQLCAVGFYTPNPDTSYEVRVDINPIYVPPVGTTTVHTESGAFAYVGFHTVRFSPPVTLPSSTEKFSIILRVTTPGYNSPGVLEMINGSYCPNASAEPGQSYHWKGGWKDVTSWCSHANYCIKAYTYPGPLRVQLSDLTAESHPDYVRLRWETADEVNTVGFLVLRSQQPDGPFEPITVQPITATAGPGEVGRYELLDRTGLPGRAYRYQLVEVTGTGRTRHLASTVAEPSPAIGLDHLVLPCAPSLLDP